MSSILNNKNTYKITDSKIGEILVQHIGQFKTNENKINNLDNKNTRKRISKKTREILYETRGYFWGLRDNTTYKNIYNQLKVENSCLLIGDVKEGLFLYNITGKFINDESEDIFDKNGFYYCFSLEKTSYKISTNDLKKFIGKSYKVQGCSNFTTNYNKYRNELINYINEINTNDFLNIN